ncbi:DUF2975 domain-containing protein [Bacillus cereus]|uniref:DUF2975 domain-containing protein n=1 Tax=Bacillus cereus TaxID=1396 RepID=UPI0039808F80
MRQKELLVRLKMIIIFSGIFVLVFCLNISTKTGKEILLNAENLKVLYKPFTIFIWITLIPFFIALVLGWLICSDIRSSQSFTVKNANRLKLISILSMVEGTLYVGAVFYLFVVGSYHTNVLIILLLILFFSIVISIFTSLLSHLVRKASEIKQDNDLTI